MLNLSALYKETDVLDSEDFCSAFTFRNICLEVLAGPHGKKEGSCRELGDGDVFYGCLSCDEFADDAGGEGFLLFGVSVRVFVPAELLLEYEGCFAGGVQSGVGPVVRPEGLCHIINGGTDRSRNQGSISFSGEAPFSNGLRECGEEKVL